MKLRNIAGLVFLILALLCTCLRSQEIRRPSTEKTTAVAPFFCSGTWMSGTMPNFWDSDPDTYTQQIALGTSTVHLRYKASQLSGFSAASGPYSSLSLKIDWSCSGTKHRCRVSYSTDGGSSFTTGETVTASGTRHVVTVSLSASQDLNLLVVQWEGCGDYDTDTRLGLTSIVDGYDVRTEGTLADVKRKFQVIATE